MNYLTRIALITCLLPALLWAGDEEQQEGDVPGWWFKPVSVAENADDFPILDGNAVCYMIDREFFSAYFLPGKTGNNSGQLVHEDERYSCPAFAD